MTPAIVQGIGVPELLIVLGIVLVIFGPKRLPMLGRQLGSGFREFKDGITKKTRDEDADEAEEIDRPALESPRTPAPEPAPEPASSETVAERDR